MTNSSILLVDDEAKILSALAQALRDEGHEVVATTSAARGAAAAGAADVRPARGRQPDAGADRARSDPRAARRTPAAERPQILMMTAHATVESAIEAMKLGAFDYLQKPFEIDELLVVANRAARSPAPPDPAPLPDQRARRRVQPLRHRRPQPADAGGDPHRRSRRAIEEHGAHHRRDRHRQGDGGARDSLSTARSARCR